ncbi:hypothetical protein E2562_039482 [Oryza meyeriana var. granulata]|uniref:Uncharacterized protein n=1 Tax=Oryza meyeriana var. granulata TaxID=110450 RepID=A0A6G1FHB6_9ORYZ|nr:hypothetical protein E2562_039482 [Oryza meyeriana var. granulata]
MTMTACRRDDDSMQARLQRLTTAAFDDQTTAAHRKRRGQGLGTVGGGIEEETMMAGPMAQWHGKAMMTKTHIGNEDDGGR